MLSTRGGGVAAATGYLRKHLVLEANTPMVTYAAARSQSPERAIQRQAMKIQCDPQLKKLDSGSFPHWGAHFLDVLKPRISPQKLTCTNERLTSEKESLTAANAWSLKLTAESET
jgi:hypothetical protein